MRIQAVFRVRELVRRLVKKIRRIAVSVLVLGFLAGSLAVGKAVLVEEIRKEVRKTFDYESLQMTSFPPALVIEEVRTLAGPPLFRAQRVKFEMPYLSLLRSRKAISIIIDSPEARIGPDVLRPRPGRPGAALSLPFIIERGVIRNGTVVYEDGGSHLEISAFRALFTQRGEQFTLRAETDDIRYSAPSDEVEITGGLDIYLTGRGDDVSIQRLKVEGPDLDFDGRGRFRNYRDPEIELDVRFELETARMAALLDLPFDWQGKAGAEGRFLRQAGQVSFETAVAAEALVLCGVPMGRIYGDFRLTPDRAAELDLVIQKPGLLPETLSLAIGGGRVEGRAARVYVDPVFKDIAVPWPVRSPAWGTFVLKDGRLEVAAEFREPGLDRVGDRFSFLGSVEVSVDFEKDLVRIATPDLQSNFARVEARSTIDLDGEIDTWIRGSVLDVKQAREFVQLILGETLDLAEIRGAGFAEVRLSGLSADPVVDIRGSFSPAGFDLLDAAFVEAETSVSGGDFQGTFRIEDPELKGEARVRADPQSTEIEIRGGEGELSKIFPALEIPVALKGLASGDIKIIQSEEGEEYFGSFSSPEVMGYGQIARNVAGRLEFRDGILSFPEIGLDLYGGRFEGRVLVGLEEGEFDVDLRGEGVDLSLLSSDAAGTLALNFDGRGMFGMDRLGGTFEVKDLDFSPLKRTEARGEIGLDIAGEQVVLELRGGLAPGDNPFEAVVDIPVSGEPFTGIVKGSLTNLDLLVPWEGARGRVDYTADIIGSDGPPQVSVDVKFEGPVLPMPGFPYPLTDFSGAGKHEDGRLNVMFFTGKLGGGEFKGSGDVGTGPDGIETMDMRAEAKGLLISPVDRVRTQLGGSLRLLKDSQRFVLEGDLLINRMNWRREIYEEFALFSTPEPAEDEEPSFFDGMSLNLRLRGDDNILLENSLGRFSGRFNLSVTGSIESPILLGDIDILSGDLYFQDRAFRVLNGRLSFTDPLSAEPYLDFRGETYIKDYRVTLNMNGPVSRLRPEFSSSPPLAPDEVLALLALGESFRRTYYTYSMDRSTTMSTASLLTFQIADQAKRRTSGLFALDRLRIDPYISETAPGAIAARLTVGKKLSDNLLLIYSTILANSTVLDDEVPIFRMEWDISRRFSLVGGRDDRGRLSFDVKFRKRF